MIKQKFKFLIKKYKKMINKNAKNQFNLKLMNFDQKSFRKIERVYNF